MSYTYQNTVAVGEHAGLSFLGLTGYAVLPKPVLKIVIPLLIYIHQRLKLNEIQSCHLVELTSVF